MKIFTPKLLTSIAAASLALGSATTALSQVSDSEISMITLTFMQNIDIAFVDPVTIADPTPGFPAVGEDTFCVAGTGFSTFSITFSNPDPGAPGFELQSAVAGAPPIFYEVFFKNDLSPGFGVPVAPESPLLGNLIQTSVCADPTSDNAKFNIEIPFPEWDGRESEGPFTGMLELTVVSE
ncbi:hypothetical protein ACCI51_17550 [Microbulbifer echini]|uniref:Uncharacterized protein n=1 Tax=Microbulbifer echini TaxID=1529067 RepID=A0ABV4NS16_9GAMM|nr:hypothetical protein [uncultured Microbulbifer sp.]